MTVRTMESAPKDGTKIRILFRHNNYQYEPSEKWQEWCDAYWTDFNGGGWVWEGIAGAPVAWSDGVIEHPSNFIRSVGVV